MVSRAGEWVHKMDQNDEIVMGRGRAHRDYVPDEHEKDYLKKLYDKLNNPKKPTEDDLLGPTKPPIDLVHAIPGEHGHPGGMGFDNEQVPQRQDLIINPSDSTEGVKFPMPIRGGGEGREQPMMTPQFGPNDPHPGELAQVDYTSPNPKFDQHMKNTPPLTKPKERIDHLKEGVKIRKA